MRASLRDPDVQSAIVAPSLLLDGVVQSLPDETMPWAGHWRDRFAV